MLLGLVDLQSARPGSVFSGNCVSIDVDFNGSEFDKDDNGGSGEGGDDCVCLFDGDCLGGGGNGDVGGAAGRGDTLAERSAPCTI